MEASASTSTVDGPLSEETTLLDLPPPILREIGWLGRSGCLPEQITVLEWKVLPRTMSPVTLWPGAKERTMIVFTVRQHDNLPLHADSEVEDANWEDEEFLRRDLKAELDRWLPDGWSPTFMWAGLSRWLPSQAWFEGGFRAWSVTIESCSPLQLYELATACTRRLCQKMGYILMEKHESIDREADSATIRFTYCRTNMWTGRYGQDDDAAHARVLRKFCGQEDMDRMTTLRFQVGDGVRMPTRCVSGKMTRVFARNGLRGVSRETDAMLSAAARPGSVRRA